MSLSLARLNAVRHVAETGTFAAASRRLGVSQPAISQHIRELENTYRVQLFRRDMEGLKPTPLCLELCDIAERLFREQSGAERLLGRRNSLSDGQINIGLGNVMPGVAAVANFHKTYPGVKLRIETGSHAQITRAVLNHDVDIGILPDVAANPRLRKTTLAHNEVVAIASKLHPLARRNEVSLSDLIAEPLIFRSSGSSTQRIVDRLFARHDMEPTPILTVDSRDGLYEAVSHNMGIGFIWRYGTSRIDRVVRLQIREDIASSVESVFALADYKSEVIDGFFRSVEEKRFID